MLPSIIVNQLSNVALLGVSYSSHANIRRYLSKSSSLPSSSSSSSYRWLYPSGGFYGSHLPAPFTMTQPISISGFVFVGRSCCCYLLYLFVCLFARNSFSLFLERTKVELNMQTFRQTTTQTHAKECWKWMAGNCGVTVFDSGIIIHFLEQLKTDEKHIRIYWI